MRIALVIVLTLALPTACAQYKPTRPGTSIQQTQADTEECAYEAFKASAQIEGAAQSAVQATLKARCMQSKGYSITD